MSFYKHHVFFCLNKREAPENCCACHGSEAMQEYAKKRVKELKLSGHGKVRVNKAGCLDRCEEGPVIVVYPEEIWYTYVDKADIDEIIEEHLVNGRVVDRLRICWARPPGARCCAGTRAGSKWSLPCRRRHARSP
jgi:(2Fe-2S) ferredoxin